MTAVPIPMHFSSPSSEEESFVILGSTPTPSLNGYLDQLNNAQPASVEATSSNGRTSLAIADSSVDALCRSAEDEREAAAVSASFRIPMDLAENAAQLKTSIVQHFPSLFAAPSSTADDLQKLDSLVCEHLELKANLEKTNTAMRQHFSMIGAWHENMKQFKAAKKRDLDTQAAEITKLKDEIITLNKELIDKSEHYELSLKLQQQENTELVQRVSHQQSIILNLTDQIASFERDQLQSFEVLHMRSPLPTANVPAANASLASSASMRSAEAEEASRQSLPLANNASMGEQLQIVKSMYESLEQQQKCTLSDHQKSVSSLKEQIDLLTAKNQEFDAMRNEYVKDASRLKHMKQAAQEEIESLKNSLAAAEAETKKLNGLTDEITAKDEIIAELRGEIRILEEQKSSLADHQKSIASLNERIALLAAKNQEFDAMKSLYVEEIECLKKNLADAEAELKKHKAVAAELPARDELIATLRTDIDMLKGQLEVYRDDFELERKSRQDMASEREEILADLKLLQRRNQELMHGRSSPTGDSTDSKPAARSAQFTCPICNRSFGESREAELHVNSCLDGSSGW